MIAPPATATPRLGPLEAPNEDEIVAAYPMLRHEALTLSWAAVALGIDVARLEALARAGELLVVPGPWSMRQAHRSGLGYFVPAWQLDPDGRGPHQALPELLTAATAASWTSLDLHRFMTTTLVPDRTSPAQLLRDGAAARVVALIRGDPEPQPAAPTPDPRRRRQLFALRALLHGEVPT